MAPVKKTRHGGLLKVSNKKKVSLIVDRMMKEGRNHAEVIVALRSAGFNSGEVDEILNHRSSLKAGSNAKIKS